MTATGALTDQPRPSCVHVSGLEFLFGDLKALFAVEHCLQIHIPFSGFALFVEPAFSRLAVRSAKLTTGVFDACKFGCSGTGVKIHHCRVESYQR
jgi:hypothetical protein